MASSRDTFRTNGAIISFLFVRPRRTFSKLILKEGFGVTLSIPLAFIKVVMEPLGLANSSH